jgi:hypothetical protein
LWIGTNSAFFNTLGKLEFNSEALIIEVTVGEITVKQVLITRIGTLSFPGALFGAIDITIDSTSSRSTAVKENCSDGK